jgi:hypothetical protein
MHACSAPSGRIRPSIKLARGRRDNAVSMANEAGQHHTGARRHADGRLRCAWCTTDPLYVAYHDNEWGVAVRADRELFEMLCLEGARA